jgi:hypothetical protein
LILLNAETGEILVMASHPGYDPNNLDETWGDLLQDPLAPLINRVTQGNYPTGDLGGLPFIQAAANPETERASLRLPLADTAFPEEATPLDVAFAATTLSNAGVMPAPRLALSYLHPEQGWLGFPPLGSDTQLLTPEEARAQLAKVQLPDPSIWQLMETPMDEDLTWYLGGSLSTENTSPFTIALVLEEENLPLAEEIGQAVLRAAAGQ